MRVFLDALDDRRHAGHLHKQFGVRASRSNVRDMGAGVPMFVDSVVGLEISERVVVLRASAFVDQNHAGFDIRIGAQTDFTPVSL